MCIIYFSNIIAGQFEMEFCLTQLLKSCLSLFYFFIFRHSVKIIRNLKYTLQKWETIKEDLDGNKWYKVEIVRRISEQDLWLKVIDIFEEVDGGERQNVFHKETSMFPDDFELNQFKRLWIKNFESLTKEKK